MPNRNYNGFNIIIIGYYMSSNWSGLDLHGARKKCNQSVRNLKNNAHSWPIRVLIWEFNTMVLRHDFWARREKPIILRVM